ncbi:uncharacterized protein PAC_19529 [Phialocephala subalpina]|uniref:B30.2/SPRY domain-containing protein n=1 Tax=Phialocephala subalpina TaxID=576137 RepID=A0A1L7XXB1_9HELO|nr:uncharacterized protein PAC_19529 [Phialocephala subalpina]
MSLIVLINGVNDSGESKTALNIRRAELFSTFFPDASVEIFDFFANDIDLLDGLYLWKQARNIINSLKKSATAPSENDLQPPAVVFLAHTTGATLVKQILLLALEHSSYQWLAFGVVGLHFFDSPCFTEPLLWDHFLIQTLAIGDIHGPRSSQLFPTLPDVLSKVEREFATVSQGFNIILHGEPQAKNDDSRLDEVVDNIRGHFRRKSMGMKTGFQALQRRLSVHTTSLSRLKPIIADLESTAWILTHPTYKSWMASEAPTVLGMIGAPGSGSTYVSSHVISALTTTNDDSQAFVLSFDFDRWDSRRNSEQALVSSLIRQLLTLNPQLYRTMENITNLLVAQSNVACGQLLALFRSFLSKVEPSRNVFLVINGADQCLQPLRGRVASLITMPSFAGSLKVLMTASTPLELPVNVLDCIRSSVGQRVAQIIFQKPAWKDSREAIIQRLCAEGCTYLQVKLNLGILERGYTPSTRKGIRQFLSKEALQPKDTFETAVGALSQGEPAGLLLNWVFHALRPLTVSELAVALTLTPDKEVAGESALDTIGDELSLTIVRDLVSSMGTILKLVDDEVMLIHHTIHDYFEAQRALLVPNFHALVTRCCLMYLSACSAHMNTTPTSANGSDQACAKPEMATAFLEYAETSWLEHYKFEPLPTKALDDEVLRFLTSGTDAFKGWVRKFRTVLQWPIDMDPGDTLLLAIQLGFRRVVQQITKSEGAIIPDRIVGAMAASARAGNIEIFRDLLGTVPPGLYLVPVLCAAAEYGRSEIVQLLMTRISASSFPSASNSQENNDPLLLATANGHTATVEVLLSHGCHIVSSEETVRDGEAPRSRTNAVHLAAQLGDVETLLTLQRLQPDEFEALVESPNSDGKSPLQLCCIAGSSQAFDILFRVSKPEDHDLHKLFSVAAEHGHLAIVDQLLSAGVSIVDGRVSTTIGPLQVGAENGHYAVVSRLIDEGKKLVNSTETLEATTRASLWKSQLSSSFEVSFDDNDNYDCRIVALLAPYRDTSGEKDNNAMMNAVYYGQVDTVKVLMDAGISVHKNRDSCPNYNGLLDSAISGNRPDSIRFLMDQGIAVQWDENWEETSIHYATRQRLSLCVRELLRKATPEDVWRKNGDNRTAFEIAVETGSAAAVKSFLDWKDGDVLFEPSLGSQRPTKILITALRSGNLDLIRLILDNGWVVNPTESRSQDPPLHVAIEVGKLDIIQMLLKRSANPDIRNNKRETPLHIAVKCKSETSIKSLLEYNANSKLVDSEYLSPLHVAVREDESDLVAALLGFEKDQPDGEPQTRTEKAIEEGAEGTTKVQTPQLGVDAEIPGSGTTPLLMAIGNRNPKIVRMLLKAGANPNGQGGGLGSLLNMAIWKRELGTIRALLNSGANTKTVTRAFGGPFHALNFGTASALEESRDIATLLLADKAEVDAADYAGGTPLMRAIFHHNMQYAELLLELGANPKIQDNLGMTSIHYAASWGSENLIKKLIGAGLDPCTLDACSCKPLYRAGLAATNDHNYEYSLQKFHTILEALPAEHRQNDLESALTAVLKAGSKELFQEIVQVKGLDTNVPDRHGWTALDVANFSPTLTEEAAILRSMGAVNGNAMKEPTRLCPCDVHYDDSLSPDGREAWVEGNTHMSTFGFGGAVRADHCIPASKPTYFEVEILELQPGNTIAIGLLQESSKLTELIGWRPGTWGYHSDDGSLISDNDTVIEDAPGYRAGQTVGVAVDLAKRKACFVLDNIWESSVFDIFGQLYPAVSFQSRDVGRPQIRINFGPEKGGTKFKHKPRDDWVETVAPAVPSALEEKQLEERPGESQTGADLHSRTSTRMATEFAAGGAAAYDEALPSRLGTQSNGYIYAQHHACAAVSSPAQPSLASE